MADTYQIIDGQVVPFNGGRKCNNTDAWRDATPLELQLQEQLAESKHVIVVQAAEIEALREEVERLRADRGSRGQQTAHTAIIHCDTCGCDWLDNGLNPAYCPYCKQHAQTAEIKTLLVEVDELREALKNALTKARAALEQEDTQ